MNLWESIWNNSGVPPQWRKLFAVVFLLFFIDLFLLIGGALYEKIESSNDRGRYPAPGALVDLGGRNLHLKCGGAGNYTLLFDSDIGEFSLYWHTLRNMLLNAPYHPYRICTYDRAGYAWSDPASDPRSAEAIADDIHRALIKAGEQKNLILISHGFTSFAHRVYVKKFPEQVKGMLFIDPVGESTFQAMEGELLYLTDTYSAVRWMATFGILRFIGPYRPTPSLPYQERRAYDAFSKAPQFYKTWIAEESAIRNSLSLIWDQPLPTQMPLVVLVSSRTKESDEVALLPQGVTIEEFNENWMNEGKSFAKLSKNFLYLTTAKSDHEIPLRDPQAVVDAIQRVRERIYR